MRGRHLCGGGLLQGRSRGQVGEIHSASRAVAVLRPRTVEEPLLEPLLDFLVARIRMTAAEILALHRHPGLEQIERRPKRLGYGRLRRSGHGLRW